MIAAALAALTLAAIPSPAATIINEPCPDITESMTTGACAYPDGRVYLPAGSTRFMREHELGHVYIEQRLDQGERSKVRRETQVPTSWPWTAPDDPYHSASERVADIYAACRLRLDPEHEWESSYDYYPSRRTLQKVCATIARAADWGPPKGIARAPLG